MNRIKKAVFGVLVAGLAFSFSAFKTTNTKAIVTYYKTDMSYPEANDPRGYQYFSSDRCETGGSLCSAIWDLGTHPGPFIDGTPLPTSGVKMRLATAVEGHFE